MTIKKYYNIAKNELYPITRSLTGKGVLKTLKILKREIPELKIKKFSSGKKVFDWKIPHEWNIEDAYVLDKNNNKIIDFKKNNLHIIGYSEPVKKILSKVELIKKLHFIKKQPKAIPYITSYYERNWGFCLTYEKFMKINNDYSNNDKFRVVINSNFKKNGKLNYGELILKGKSQREILISTYICHPSMANNELSGPVVSMGLANFFRKRNLKKTLRFIFIPETIGSISYLNKNLKHLKENVIGGFNISCIGDEREFSCMLSKYSNSPSDEALIDAFKILKIRNYKIYSFLKRGSDERQYNSPGIDLKISSIFRSKYGEYPEYHTSLDNFDLVTLKGCNGGYEVAKKSINLLLERIYPRCEFLCEPFMSKRGLRTSFSNINKNIFFDKCMDFMQYADGTNSLKKIAQLIRLDYKSTQKIFYKLKKNKLIKL